MIRGNFRKLVRGSGLLLIALTSWLCISQRVFATLNYSDITGYHYENFNGLSNVHGSNNAWS